MSKPDYLDQLIDDASKAAGNDAQLAKLLDVGRATVHQWRKGLKPCPAGDQALMASLAGLKAEEWLARAVVAQYEGTSKGDKLFRALGKALIVTGAAVASSGASAHQIFSSKGGGLLDAVTNLLYTMYRSVKFQTEWLQMIQLNRCSPLLKANLSPVYRAFLRA